MRDTEELAEEGTAEEAAVRGTAEGVGLHKMEGTAEEAEMEGTAVAAVVGTAGQSTAVVEDTAGQGIAEEGTVVAVGKEEGTAERLVEGLESIQGLVVLKHKQEQQGDPRAILGDLGMLRREEADAAVAVAVVVGREGVADGTDWVVESASACAN